MVKKHLLRLLQIKPGVRLAWCGTLVQIGRYFDMPTALLPYTWRAELATCPECLLSRNINLNETQNRRRAAERVRKRRFRVRRKKIETANFRWTDGPLVV